MENTQNRGFQNITHKKSKKLIVSLSGHNQTKKMYKKYWGA